MQSVLYTIIDGSMSRAIPHPSLVFDTKTVLEETTMYYRHRGFAPMVRLCKKFGMAMPPKTPSVYGSISVTHRLADGRDLVMIAVDHGEQYTDFPDVVMHEHKDEKKVFARGLWKHHGKWTIRHVQDAMKDDEEIAGVDNASVAWNIEVTDEPTIYRGYGGKRVDETVAPLIAPFFAILV